MPGERKAERGRVLLVEDEDLLRWSVERFLLKRGFEVASAKDGREAVERIAAEPFDLVITDLALAGVDGLAVASDARRLRPETQVVIITGHGSKETVIQALRHGVVDYVEKPFDLELLLIVVERALEKTMLQRELVRLARTDGLTGLFNQRHFYVALETEIGRARRQGHPLALLLVDVDEFKAYNDRHGHLAGDAALARIAACLRGACRRDIDAAYRYGGDEFVLLLPEADRAVAARVAERVRVLLEDEGVGLTVSIGFAELGPGQDLKALIHAADVAMYRNKAGPAATEGGRSG